MVKLDATELRVLACLVEKSMTTPEYYPMSLNAVTNACNQKSNREPVMSLAEVDVQNALGRLINKHLVMDKTGIGGRVRKFAHRMSGTLSQEMEFTPAELAVLSELMLRGPQTAGELRSRAQRMHKFSTLDEVIQTVTGLQDRAGESYVEELPREAGRRENRFQHLLGESLQSDHAAMPVKPAPDTAVPQIPMSIENRLLDLERRLARLESLIVNNEQQDHE